eukprot:CAMPEP_0119093174 /NCGR_PEP_ID=MMETSP1178-20130426/162258_1 /TAXON_ID=33656 /ORGANISM="unid sp, Strain CCMP2000" /LENGTH=59 /DNA_ID=CAMNT_0007076813 /DNA_START=66 /DNA_END=242 /DNA_ORIENTATION=-
MARLPVADGARGHLSLAGVGYALLFVYKMRTKYSPATMGAEEVSGELHILHEAARSWLR